MAWVLVLTVMAMASVTTGSEKIGDIIHSGAMGVADTIDNCNLAGQALVRTFDREGQGSVMAMYNCLEMPLDKALELSKAQEWEVNP